MVAHIGQAFSTKDRDNDTHTIEHCAGRYKRCVVA